MVWSLFVAMLLWKDKIPSYSHFKRLHGKVKVKVKVKVKLTLEYATKAQRCNTGIALELLFL